MTAASDADLWQEMAQTVKQKPSTRAHPKSEDIAVHSEKQQKSSKKLPKKQKLLAVSPPPPVASQKRPADLRIGQRAGIDKSSTRRLTQGRYDIDDRLDLHGVTQAAARAKLLHFIERAAIRGLRTVLVITGKGASGQGVLRQSVPVWLKEPPLADLVVAISHASGKDGGSGALYVRLRRRRETSPL